MNNKRRQLIKNGVELIEKGKNILQQVLDDEEMAFDNLSEGLQQTMRGEEMQENIDILNEVIEGIDNALEEMDNIM